MQKEGYNTVEKRRLKTLGKGLKELRKAKGYSNYHKLADELGMTHSQYSSYEAGMKNLTINSLFRVLDFHEISLQEFTSTYLNKI